MTTVVYATPKQNKGKYARIEEVTLTCPLCEHVNVIRTSVFLYCDETPCDEYGYGGSHRIWFECGERDKNGCGADVYLHDS